MPRKGMRSLCFYHSKTESMSLSSSSSMALFPAADQIIESAAALILKWDPESTPYARVTSLFYESRSEAEAMIRSVADLQRLMHFLLTHSPSSDTLVAAQTLMQIAMKRLQKEFYQILSTNRAYLHPESVSTRSSSLSDFTDDDENSDESLSSTAMDDLRAIAHSMISAGYAKECISIYNVIRKSVLDEGLYRLGLDRLSPSKLPWPAVELRVKTWLRALKMSLRTLFYGERILCDHVFSASPSVRDSSFAHVSRDAALLLFSFPEMILTKAIAKRKSSFPPEKLFRALDMYSAIYENWAEIESVFDLDSTAAVRDQAYSALVKIAEFVRADLSEFESSIHKDSSKTPPRGGGLHRLTLRVTNHLTMLADYPNALTDVLRDSPPPTRPQPLLLLLDEDQTAETEEDEESSTSAAARMGWLVVLLLCKLDSKAKRYDEASASYLFLANNLHHIVAKARGSNLRYMLGQDWCDRHDRKVRQFAANYERLAWGKPICALPADQDDQVSPEEAKIIFRAFNASFEEALRRQRWSVVSDNKLRDQIIHSLTNNLVSAYAAFYHNHAAAAKYTPDHVHNCIAELFQNDIALEEPLAITTTTTMSTATTPYSSSASSSPVSSSSSHGRRRHWSLR